MKDPDHLAIVTAALPLLASPSSEADLIQQLMATGVSRNIARQLDGFVPSAFGRVLLQSFSPRFHDVYCLVSEVDGSHLILPLADEPIYCAALTLAQHAATSQTWDMKLHQLIAARSAEVNAVNSFLEQDKEVYGLKFTPLIITWDIGFRTLKPGAINPIPTFVPPYNPDIALIGQNPDSSKQVAHSKPWWKFWS